MAEQSNRIDDATDYRTCKEALHETIDKEKNSTNRFQSGKERKEESAYDKNFVKAVCRGKYKSCWRGVNIMKDPLDLVIYQELLWDVRPKTIFETGAYTGACALWMADLMNLYNSPVHIYSMDIDIGMVDPLAKKAKNISFIEENVLNIEKLFDSKFLEQCPHPWVISEDCHVDATLVMEHFHKYMVEGDYFIIEDTGPTTPLKSGQGLLDGEYEEWGRDKLDQLNRFLEKYSEFYKVDSYFTDFFGYNGTFNWNGYVKRIK